MLNWIVRNKTVWSFNFVYLCLPMAWETGVQSLVKSLSKTQKMVLDAAFLNTQFYKVWSNPGKGLVPSPTPQCSSSWKGSLQVTLGSGCQLYVKRGFDVK